MVGCTAQGVSISRSCAMSYCEPCQSLTAAALSRRWRVPQGNFEGATYVVSASVMFIEDGAQFFCMKSQIDVCVRKKSPHLRTFLMFFEFNYCLCTLCFQTPLFSSYFAFSKAFFQIAFTPQAFLGSFLRFCNQIGFIFVLSDDKLSLDVAFCKGEIADKR